MATEREETGNQGTRALRGFGTSQRVDGATQNRALRESLRTVTRCSDVLRLISSQDASVGGGKKTGRERTRGGMFYSPFREESSPSFHIDERKNIWYDHGGKRGGDAYGLCKEYLISVKHFSANSAALSDEIYKMLSAASGLPSPRPETTAAPRAQEKTEKEVNVWAGSGENAVLSNMATRPFFHAGVSFVSVEQAFQYRKAVTAGDTATAQAILGTEDPAEARRLGRKAQFQSAKDLSRWEQERFDAMRDLIYASFNQNPEAKEALMKTGTARITHRQGTAPWNTEFPKILMETRLVFSQEYIDHEGQKAEYAETRSINIGSIRPFDLVYEKNSAGARQAIDYAQSCGISLNRLAHFCKYVEYSFMEGGSAFLPGIFFQNSTPAEDGSLPCGEIRGLPYLSRMSGTMDPGLKMSYGPKELTILNTDGELVPLNEEPLYGNIAVAEGWKDILSFMDFDAATRKQKDYFDFYVVLNSTSLVSHLTDRLQIEETSVTALLDNDNSGKAATQELRSFCNANGYEFYDMSRLYRHSPKADFNQYYTCRGLATKMIPVGSMVFPDGKGSGIAALAEATGLSAATIARYGNEVSYTIPADGTGQMSRLSAVAFPCVGGGMSSRIIYTPRQLNVSASKAWSITDGISVISSNKPTEEILVFGTFPDALAFMEWNGWEGPKDGVEMIIINEPSDGLIDESMERIDRTARNSGTLRRVHLFLPVKDSWKDAGEKVMQHCSDAGISVDSPGEKICSIPGIPTLCGTWKKVKEARTSAPAASLSGQPQQPASADESARKSKDRLVRLVRFTTPVTRDVAKARKDDLFVFTDNTDRDSGKRVVDPESAYYKRYGDGTHDLHYPTQTTAVIRGLDNAYPVSTQRYYHEGAKGESGRWTDADEEAFRQTVREEFSIIKDAIAEKAKAGRPFCVVMPGSEKGGDGFTDGKISAITKERTPALHAIIAEELAALRQFVDGINQAAVRTETQDDITVDFPSESHEEEAALPTESDLLKGFTVFSGGAVGADSFWGEVMGRHGATVLHYYYGNKTPAGNSPISDEQYREGIEHVNRANETLGRQGFEKYMPLLSRSWFQVKNSEAVIAVGKMEYGKVDGGTAWAVQMATDERIPVYFFDQESRKWIQRVYRPLGDSRISASWITMSQPPVIPRRAGLIGTRHLSESGRDAIREAVTKTITELTARKIPHRAMR